MTKIKEKRAIKLFSEQEVLFRERTGNTFEFFYNKYHPKLINFTFQMCGDIQKAEDITTEAFLRAFERVEKYDKEQSYFSTWLFTIAKNEWLQEVKKSRTVSIDVELDTEGTTLKDFLADEESQSPFHEMKQKKAEIMMRHISELKDPYRKVIELRELQKVSYKEISLQLPIYEFTKKFAAIGEVVKSKFKLNGDHIHYRLVKTDDDPQCYFTTIEDVHPDYWDEFHLLMETEIGNKIDKASCLLSDRTMVWFLQPKNLSTVKSQIKNGRTILMNRTKKEFDVIESMFE